MADAGAWQSAIGFKRVLPPRNLTYTSNSPSYTKWSAITSNTPSWTGHAVTSWSISPALPTGLSFNTSTGIITGTPTSSIYSASHTVTAANAGGSTTRALTISVILSPYTWIGTTSNVWATGTNWYGGAAPSTNTHVAIFDNECTQCNASISSAATARSIQMKNNYTGTITQVAGAGNTVNLGTNWHSSFGGLEIDSGIFVGGNANIRADYILLNGGTFTSTSSELRIGFDTQYGVNSNFGFSFTSPGVFNHNNGSIYFDAQVASVGERGCATITLNQAVVFYNLSFDCYDYSSDDSYNSGSIDIIGSVGLIQVLNELHFYNGWTSNGSIEFFGADVDFYCDSPSSPNLCSGAVLTNFSNSGNRTTQLVFKGSTAQTYSFQDGATAPYLIIDNTSGVSPGTTAGTLNLAAINVLNGAFTAPSSTLQFTEGTEIRHNDATIGLAVSTTGSFVHNNGTVVLGGRFNNTDSREMFRFSFNPKSATFYNLILNQRPTSVAAGREERYTTIPFGTTITILNDYTAKSGRIVESGSGVNPVLIIRGDYRRECANLSTHDCADEDNAVDKRFDTNGTNIFNDNPSDTECNGCVYTFNPGAGNTVTLDSGLINLRSSGFVLSSGTLNIASGGGAILGNNLVNDAAITCFAGRHIYYLGSLSGTPGGGNDASCYRNTPVDAIPGAINWVDFNGTSTIQTFSSLDHAARIQISSLNTLGTPTMQYRLNGGADGSWVTVASGSSTNFPVMNGHFIEFRVTGTSTHSGTFTIRNLTDSSNILDTVTGTVP